MRFTKPPHRTVLQGGFGKWDRDCYFCTVGGLYFFFPSLAANSRSKALRTAAPFVIPSRAHKASSRSSVSRSRQMLKRMFFGLSTLGLPVLGDTFFTSLSITPLLYSRRSGKSIAFLKTVEKIGEVQTSPIFE